MSTPPPDESWPRPATPQDTQPILPPGSTVDPPPSGLPRDEVNAAAAAPVDWQSRYEQQHKRARIFMATTAAAVAALLGSLFFAVAQGGATAPGSVNPAGIGRPGQLPGQDGRGPMGGPQGFDHHDEWDDHHEDDDEDDDSEDSDDA